MKPADRPDDEAQRLQALRSLAVLDTAPDPVLDGLVRCASQLTGCPVALVTLVDDDRQWFLAANGTSLKQTPREHAFCAHVVAGSDGLMEVPDTHRDERFFDNPLVTGEPHIRFYAGVPVQALGHRLGTLCVIDQQPRELDDARRALLVDLAQAVSHWMQARHEHQLLLLQQQRLADFAAAGSDWMWECDQAWRYVWVSEGIAGISGLVAADLHGQGVPDAALLDEEGWPLQPPRSVHDLLRAGQPFMRAVVRREYPSGARMVSISARPWLDAAGRPLGWRGVARDVSALVAARQLARQHLQTLAKIADELPGFVYQYRLRPDGTVHFPFASQGAREVYELEPEVLVRDGAVALDRIHPQDLPRVQASILASAHSLERWRCEYRVQLPTRGERWLEGVARPEREADGSVLWHGFISDVTARREQALRVQAAEQRRLAAEQASHEKSLFLARASHELRTPLNAVMGFTQLLLGSGDDPLGPRQQQQVAQVQRSARQLLALIDDLLQVGQADFGDTQPHTTPPGPTLSESAPDPQAPGAPALLYVEDDPVNTLLVQEVIRARTTWRLFTATDVHQGLALAREHRPALVLTDMNLTGHSGLEVLQALRADPALCDTVCVALSADALPEHVEAALQAGFDDYITKPVELNRLVQRLAGWLARGRRTAG